MSTIQANICTSMDRKVDVMTAWNQLSAVNCESKQLVSSDQWKKQNDQADTIGKRLLSDDFWKKIEKYVKVLWPVMAMLRVVDRDEPIMSVVYEAIDQMLEQIKEILEEDKDGTLMYEEIRELAQERWDMLHSPLHATDFLLNPILFSKKPYKDKEVMKGWRKTLDRVGRDEEEKTTLKAQLSDYISLQGEFEDTSTFATCKSFLLLQGGRIMVSGLYSCKCCQFMSYLKFQALQLVRGIGPLMAS
ncbi:hypothetical protein L7F22_036399 [Adiantum nelumboides]|nr:hypothetical protein [Adiantum nelumboides]